MGSVVPSKLYSVFCGSQGLLAKGNPCRLFVDPPATYQVPADCETTQCVVQTSGQDSELVVACYYRGQEIMCCGHGLLGAAYYQLGVLGQTQLLLKMNSSKVLAIKDGDRIWLQFQAVQPVSCPVPSWVGEYFAQPPIRAATMGGDQSYLVLEWAANYDLTQLPVPSLKLGCHTQRALICTNRSVNSEIDINFRYFAPQYGVPEDIATGSAMRILASYWQDESLTAIQLSLQRGLLFSRKLNSRIQIGGYCKYIVERETRP